MVERAPYPVDQPAQQGALKLFRLEYETMRVTGVTSETGGWSVRVGSSRPKNGFHCYSLILQVIIENRWYSFYFPVTIKDVPSC
jgi:hypothetical protein